MTQFSKDMNIIAALEDLPNDTGDDPLTAAELKAKFDEGGLALKQFINETLIPEITAAVLAKLTAPENDGSNGQYLQTDGAGNLSWATPSGAGDMLQSVYDTLADGTVNEARACSGNSATASALLNGQVTTKLFLNSNCYGNSLPTNDYTAGRIFFKKV